jgi:DNA-binding MarR family transcriptional regulator
MSSWLTDDEQRAWRAFRSTVLAVDTAVARDLSRDSGLSMPDYQVLSALSEAERHRQRLTELAARMRWSPSRLSHHVRRMQARGLVDRTGCPDDLRGAYVVLTAEGLRVLEAAAPGHVASVRRHLIDLLDERHLTALTEIGERVAAHAADAAGQSAKRRPVSRS